jgi:hypothetical protein
MHASKFAILALITGNLFGCVTVAREGSPGTNVSTPVAPVPAERLGLNETKIRMNVEGGFMRELSQEFSDELKFRMRITEEHATSKWFPVFGVCLKEAASEASACMQFARISGMGPDFRAVFYYLANKQAPRQHKLYW